MRVRSICYVLFIAILTTSFVRGRTENIEQEAWVEQTLQQLTEEYGLKGKKNS